MHAPHPPLLIARLERTRPPSHAISRRRRRTVPSQMQVLLSHSAALLCSLCLSLARCSRYARSRYACSRYAHAHLHVTSPRHLAAAPRRVAASSASRPSSRLPPAASWSGRALVPHRQLLRQLHQGEPLLVVKMADRRARGGRRRRPRVTSSAAWRLPPRGAVRRVAPCRLGCLASTPSVGACVALLHLVQWHGRVGSLHVGHAELSLHLVEHLRHRRPGRRVGVEDVEVGLPEHRAEL